jgi:hypothetical protein
VLPHLQGDAITIQASLNGGAMVGRLGGWPRDAQSCEFFQGSFVSHREIGMGKFPSRALSKDTFKDGVCDGFIRENRATQLHAQPCSLASLQSTEGIDARDRRDN